MERHTPVLLEHVTRLLAPQPGETFMDLTAGFGGHSAALLTKVGKSGYGYLFDQDFQAIQALHERFDGQDNVMVVQSNFDEIDWEHMPKVDMILLDLGVSSVQLDEPERGFSFRADGPLDMRMDQESGESVAELVATLGESELANIIYQYGEERHSRRIARAIVEARKVNTIDRTAQLADIVTKALGGRGKIHPATKTFQALRIAVNDELGVLERTLPKAAAALAPGGRLAVISFHSLEDRIVKHFFRSLTTAERNEMGQDVSVPEFTQVTKKPITGLDEADTNPRARSAKLRAVEHKK